MFFLVLVILFMSVGSLGTVALANYTNVLIEASVVNVRLGPGLTYDIMTQIQGGTAVNVLAEKNEWYKVRLADNRIGWIASWLINNTEVAASQNLIATVLESSVNIREENNVDSDVVGSAVSGDKFDLLYEENGWSQIHYNDQVAWILSSLIEISPGSIQETIETESSQDETAVAIDENTALVLFNDVNVRSGPSLDKKILWNTNKGDSYSLVGTNGDFYEILDSDGQTGFIATWLVDTNSSIEENNIVQTNTALSEATIVIDPGHGGIDPGAEGIDLYEKEVTLKTAEQVAEKLRSSGANVILTRTADEDISLEERAWISNSSNADLFISIHYDSTSEGVYGTGVTTYYYQDEHLALAELMNSKLEQFLPLQNNGSRFGNYLVLRENTQPSVLLELGYINNNDDLNTFDTDYYRGLVADSLYEALVEYFE